MKISEEKRIEGEKVKAIFFYYKSLRPIIVRRVKALHLPKGLSNGQQGEEMCF